MFDWFLQITWKQVTFAFDVQVTKVTTGFSLDLSGLWLFPCIACKVCHSHLKPAAMNALMHPFLSLPLWLLHVCILQGHCAASAHCESSAARAKDSAPVWPSLPSGPALGFQEQNGVLCVRCGNVRSETVMLGTRYLKGFLPVGFPPSSLTREIVWEITEPSGGWSTPSIKPSFGSYPSYAWLPSLTHKISQPHQQIVLCL